MTLHVGGQMPGRHLARVWALVTTLAPAALAQSPQYRSPAGVEYRAQADTGAIARAQAASAADSADVDLLIRLGIAQSGGRPVRRSFETFSRGLARHPHDASRLPWR